MPSHEPSQHSMLSRSLSGVVHALLAAQLSLLLTWLFLLSSSLVGTQGASLHATLFAAGAYGILVVLLVPIGAVFARLFRGVQTEVLTLERALVLALLCIMLSILLVSPTRLVSEFLVPVGLDIRPAFVELFAWFLSSVFAALFCWGLGRQLWKVSLLSVLWLGGLALFLVRVLANQPHAQISAGVQIYADVAAAGFWFLFLAPISSFLYYGPSKPHLAQATRLPRSLAHIGLLALGASILLLFATLGVRSQSRADMVREYPGAASTVAAIRTLFDSDGDGFASQLAGGDCDDGNAEVYPGALEVVGNGIDDNCSGGDLLESRYAEWSVRETPRQHNLVLITIDAWRADSLGEYRGAAVMPEMQAFAEEALVFNHTYAQASYTDHSLRSLLTGRYPMDFTNGAQFFGQEPTMFELLSDLGYDVTCLQQIALLSPYITLGCQSLDVTLSSQNEHFNGKTSAAMTELALTAYRRHRAAEKPFALWVHYFDPHSNYLPEPDAPWQGKDVPSRYYQEVWSTDRAMAPLLKELLAAEDTVVVVTGDHGEMLGENGLFGHGHMLSEQVMKVPLIIRGPEPLAASIDTPVGLIDVFPTALALISGMAFPGDGLDLRPLWEDRAASAAFTARPLFSLSYYLGANKRAAWLNQWKLIQDLGGGAEELYDLSLDPSESSNLIERNSGRASELRDETGKRWDRSHNDLVLGRKFEMLEGRVIDTPEFHRREREIRRRDCMQGDKAACAAL